MIIVRKWGGGGCTYNLLEGVYWNAAITWIICNQIFYTETKIV